MIFIVHVHGLFLYKIKKKEITITNAFQKMLDKSNRKPNKNSCSGLPAFKSGSC